MKKTLKITINTCILLILPVCLLVAGEVVYRLYGKCVHNIPFTMSINMFSDRQLGWKGKKVFGNTESEKFKIFIVGDSFTQGCGVEEKHMFYNVLGRELDAEIFVYGGGGYGTLQEYMVIDRYFDEITPDMVILQTCHNDFINNLWELESASFFNNNLKIRPYLVNGKIEYYFPKFPGRLRIFLSSYSRIFYSLAKRTDRLLSRLARVGFLQSVEKRIEEEGMQFGRFNRAVEITDDLAGRIKARAGDTPVAVFSIGKKEMFGTISRNNNIIFLGDMDEKIAEEEKKTGSMRLKDGIHWNKKAHYICGNILAEELRKIGPGKKSPLLNQKSHPITGH